VSHLSRGDYRVEPYDDAAEEAVTRYPLRRVLVAAELASHAAGLGQPSLEALGVHESHRASTPVACHSTP